MEKKPSPFTSLLLLFGGLFALFFAMILSAATMLQTGQPVKGDGPSFGVVEIKGVLDDSRTITEQLRKFADDDDIAGIILRVDSPGGPVAPAQEVYREVVRARAKKKVYVSMGTVAASGGYYASCAADKIFANPGTLTGSIGVITQVVHVEEVLDELMVGTETFKSGKLKDSGSPLREPTEQDRKLFQGLVEDVFEQFESTVAKERNLSEEVMARLADGRVVSGEQAKELGLVDELGNLYDTAEALRKALNETGTPNLVYPGRNPEDIIKDILEKGLSGAMQSLLKMDRAQIQYRAF